VQIVRSVNGILQTLAATCLARSGESSRLVTGFAAIDGLAPSGGFATRAVHEMLSETGAPSLVLPLLVARAAAPNGWIVWCDLDRQFYPPGAAAMGLPLERLIILRTAGEKEQLWAATECLRSAGVAACVMAQSRLTFVQARRLQLAAERGGGVGLLLRPANAVSRPYAAATRWIVRPAAGERTVQRWVVKLIHGHGGRVGESVLLEVYRETHHVRAISRVAHRSGETKAAAASA
jgi:protein ImuA